MAQANRKAEELDRLFEGFAIRGRQLYIVGGAVRDFLMGADFAELPDLDFATDAQPGETLAILKSLGFSSYDVGRKFGTVGTVMYKVRPSGGPTDCQITTFRASEHYAAGSRHPAVVFGTRVEEDLRRRDFTINSIAMTRAGALIDPFDGASDIERRVLRSAGDPVEALHEDPLRILRIARFMSTLGFHPDEALRAAAESRAESILAISRERWLMEMDKLLMGKEPAAALEFLRETRVLGLILPEVAALHGFHHACEVHHKDLWDHTLRVLEKSEPTRVQRWAALVHDTGKVWTRRVDENNQVHFFRHEAHSATLFEGIAARFRFDGSTKNAVRRVVALHGLVPSYQPVWTDSAVRRAARKAGDELEDLLDFAKADLTTAIPERRKTALEAVEHLRERVIQLDAAEALRPVLPPHIGKHIIDALGLQPGPEIGELVRSLEDAALEGKIRATPTVSECIEHLRASSQEQPETGLHEGDEIQT